MVRFGSSDSPEGSGDEPTGPVNYPVPPAMPQAPYPGTGPMDHRGYPGAYPGYAGPEQQPGSFGFPEPPRTPWFRRRSVLIVWIGLITAMVALFIWGVIQITSRGPDHPVGPGSTSPTSTLAATTTTSPSSTTTSPAPTTTTAPGSVPPASTTAPQPPPPTGRPTTTHRHPHLPSLPSVITIPPVPRVPELPTVIPVPPIP